MKIASLNFPYMPGEYYHRQAARMRSLAHDATILAIRDHLTDVALQYEKLAEVPKPATAILNKMLTKDTFSGVHTLSVAGFLLYAVIAMSAHFVMSLGQTLFHRYLGHRRLGGRSFKTHVQFHHAHYSGDRVVPADYLDNGDNNTLFFLSSVALVLFMVLLAAMFLSFTHSLY
jgi:hypothetical protein